MKLVRREKSTASQPLKNEWFDGILANKRNLKTSLVPVLKAYTHHLHLNLDGTMKLEPGTLHNYDKFRNSANEAIGTRNRRTGN